ncbi:MAG: phosphoribosylformylglycinamidine cyclo-ligase [Miltoncostaeaceae bacterium]|nr:phosphoribosylformylglycinamidine cyclo-ligase [Miltoncostaeaceae bacterium]
MNPTPTNRYESAGVDYEVLDAGKREALATAARTSAGALTRRGADPIDESRGEPAFAFRHGRETLATVLECLGTKSVIARQYVDAGGPNLFRNVGVDTVAAIVNDLICVGALPLVVHAYFATGSAAWYEDRSRFAALVEGWRAGCEQAGAVWGGGESPTLSGLVADADIELAGSAVGVVPDGRVILGRELEPGDEIVLLASSGLHSNGASLVRSVADELPAGLRTPLPSGAEFGAAALTPSLIYVPVIDALLRSPVTITYLSHITGHGLRKLMRASRELTYRIDALPEVPEFLAQLADRAGMDPRSAYGTLNMGVGFAVFCRPGDGERVVGLAADLGYAAMIGGRVEEGPRRVVLEPLGVTFGGEELELRST